MPRHSALRGPLSPRRWAASLLAAALLVALLPGMLVGRQALATVRLAAFSDGPPWEAAPRGRLVPATGAARPLFAMAAAALDHAIPWPISPGANRMRRRPRAAAYRTAALADAPPRAVAPGVQSRAIMAGLSDAPVRQAGVSARTRPVLAIAVFLRRAYAPPPNPDTADVPAPPSAASDRGGAQPLLRHRATVWLTAYDLTGPTATGVQAGPGICAVDPSYIPLGTRITIDGLGSCLAADTGPAVIGAHIDLWVPTAWQAFALTGWYIIQW